MTRARPSSDISSGPARREETESGVLLGAGYVVWDLFAERHLRRAGFAR